MFSGPFIWTHLDFSPLLFCKARTPHSFSVLTNRLFVHFFTWRLVHFSSCLFTFSPICSALAFRQLRPVMRQTAVREDKAFTQILFVCRREPLLGHSGSCRGHCTAKHVALFNFFWRIQAAEYMAGNRNSHRNSLFPNNESHEPIHTNLRRTHHAKCRYHATSS